MKAQLFGVGLVIALFGIGCGDDDDGGKKKGGDGGGGSSGSSGWTAAVGAEATLLRTYDDEHTNARKRVAFALSGVSCVSNRTGWAVGDGGSILTTRDSGVTWTPQSSGVTTALRSV